MKNPTWLLCVMLLTITAVSGCERGWRRAYGECENRVKTAECPPVTPSSTHVR